MTFNLARGSEPASVAIEANIVIIGEVNGHLLEQ